jgi:predicted nucleotidyltransferase
MDERVDLIDGVVYADLFDCAATADEVWRYCRRRVGRAELVSRLRTDPGLSALVRERDGLYCLRGREALLGARGGRRARALVLRRRARRVARVLQHAPFVRGLLLTGSAAAADAGPDADLDLLVVVAPRRLATSFLVLGSLARLLGGGVLCPNQYRSEDHLSLAEGDVYVARELAQAHPLAGRGRDLWAANRWIATLLPNVGSGPRAEVAPLPGGRLVQRLVERPLRGRLGDAVEHRLARLGMARLVAHHRRFGTAPPATVVESFRDGVELRFHGAPIHGWLLERYRDRRAELAAELARADRSRLAAGTGNAVPAAEAPASPPPAR